MSIEILNLTQVYNQNTPFEKVALNNINLSINKGEFVGIIGHTGSGKSTLLSVIAGIEKPQGGEIFFDDSKSDFNDVLRKYDVSMIYQSYMLFDYMNAVENVIVNTRAVTNDS